jgi:Tfp pilus assembly protein PilF
MVALALAAMLSHETAYLLPLLAVLIAGFESKERGRSAIFGVAPTRLIGIGLLVGVLLVVLGYRLLVLGGLGFSGGYPTDSVFGNIGTAVRHFWYLVEHALLPVEPVVSDAWKISQGWGVIESLALLGLIVATAAVLVGLKIGHPVAFGAGWLMLWVIPGVGIFPTDHYHSSQTLYLATWGVALIVGYGLFRLWRPVGRQLVPGSEVVVFLPVLIVLGVITGLSNARWWTHDGLFQSEIASDPHYMEGRMELAKSALRRGAHDEAMNHAMAAIEAAQDDSFTGYWSPRDTFFVLARSQWALGMTTEAARNFATALEHRPDDAELLYWRGVSRVALQEYEGAEQDLSRALEMRRSFPEAEAELGVLMVRQSRFAEAYPLLSSALDQGLGTFERHTAMAQTMIDAGELSEAADQLEAALALRESADERARLAWVSWRLGRTDKAMSDLNMALQFEETSSDYVEQVRREISEAAEVSPP